jgi:hypothetical protein
MNILRYDHLKFSDILNFKAKKSNYFIDRKTNITTKEQTELINKIKSIKDQIANGGLMVSNKHKIKLTSLVDKLNLKQQNISSRNENKMELTVFKTSPRLLTRSTAQSSFIKHKLNPISISDLNELFTSRSYDDNKSTSRVMTNNDLNLLCPVSLHLKMAFEKYDHDCRCKKQIVPLIYDIEFDYILRMIPLNQLAVIVIMDSK